VWLQSGTADYLVDSTLEPGVLSPENSLDGEPLKNKNCGETVNLLNSYDRSEVEMIVRDVESTEGTVRHVSGAGWDSKRLIVADDAVGFSVHDTTVNEGAEMELQYKHHVEANYCFSGEGELVEVFSGRVFPIRPGTIYVLDQHDRHIIRALKGDLRLVCVFNPALAGGETHTADGSFEPISQARSAS
jgi:L-ectoine synthase